MNSRVIIIFLLLLSFSSSYSQPVAPEILAKEWRAKWITAPGISGQEYGIYHFRKSIDLSEAPKQFIIHVSGDNRYKLYVNDSLVSLGPARADLFHWNFETVDLARYLHAGKNVLAALVWNFGEYRQEAQISYRTAFILQGDGEREEMVNTNESWKCDIDKGYQPNPVTFHYAYFVAGPGEKVDLHFYPKEWTSPAFDDGQWQQATELFNGLPKGVFSYNPGWMLVPRPIPQVSLRVQRLRSIRKVTGGELPREFLTGSSEARVPSHSHLVALLDQGYETNAYPVIRFSRGKDATVSLGYAEALFLKNGDKILHTKGNRNEVEGKGFVGVFDEIKTDGKENQQFTPLSWRTFRYVLLDVVTGDEPLVLQDIYDIQTGYPFKFRAQFHAGDTLLNKILETGWRTARNCAVETYMDCPYYEQLQYVGDTRIQALVSLFNSGDDRLMRNAISQIDHSRMAEGITQSRYPTNTPQQIPTFSLWWIGMVHDFWMYRNDVAFVKQFLPGERQVLDFFSRYQDASGSLRHAPYWEFTDWSEGKGWQNGIPPTGADGSSSELDFQLLWAYQLAAQLEDSLGMRSLANVYRQKAGQLAQTVKAKYWDSQRSLFADTKEKKSFSQHSNTLAILTHVVEGKEATGLMKRILSDTSLTEATIYFKYYVNLALREAGLGDSYLDQLSIWKEDLANGLTTWAEMSNISASRSDCHAWGASPNIELFRTVLGFDTEAPGFSKIRIAPHLGKLAKVSGSIPHPKGTIEASYELKKEGWKIRVSLPKGTEGEMIFLGKSYPLHEGASEFTIPANVSKRA